MKGSAQARKDLTWAPETSGPILCETFARIHKAHTILMSTTTLRTFGNLQLPTCTSGNLSFRNSGIAESSRRRTLLGFRRLAARNRFTSRQRNASSNSVAVVKLADVDRASTTVVSVAFHFTIPIQPASFAFASSGSVQQAFIRNASRCSVPQSCAGIADKTLYVRHSSV